MIVVFDTNAYRDPVNKNIDNIKRIKLHIDNAEESLAIEIQGFIKNIDPASTDWQLFKKDKKKRMQHLDFIRSSEFDVQTSFAMLCASVISTFWAIGTSATANVL